jgi:hypothetical protein
MDQVDYLESTPVVRTFVLYDWNDTATVWGYVTGQQRGSVILELSVEKAVVRGATEMPDKVSNCSIYSLHRR